MRIWLIGADERGTEVLGQLQKNPNIEIYVTHPTDRPLAVVQKLIDQVDLVEVVTPANINTLARRIRPDLILIDATVKQHNLGRFAGGGAFATALNDEIAASSDYPCLILD